MAQTSEFLIRITSDLKGAKEAALALKSTGVAVTEVSAAQDKAGKSSVTLTQNLIRLIQRAALTIPIWLALRGAILGVFRTIGAGLEDLRELEQAFLRLKNIFRDLPGGLEESFSGIRTIINDLSVETGQSVKSLSDSLVSFAQTGLTLQESIAGLNAASRLTVALQGDQKEITDALALAYRLLGSTINQTLPVQQQFELLAGQILVLDQKNAFTINELSEGLKKFAGTARNLNLTLGESVAFLAALNSAGLKGGEAGNLLKTTFTLFVNNLEEVRKQLNLLLPESASVEEKILLVLARIKELVDAGREEEAINSISRIFGGARSLRVVASLVSVFDLLQDNLKKVGNETENLKEAFEALRAPGEEAGQTLNKQLERTARLRRQIGQEFLLGLAGTRDLSEAQKFYNDLLEQAVNLARDLASSLSLGTTSLSQTFRLRGENRQSPFGRASDNQLRDLSTRAFRGELNVTEIQNLIKVIQNLRDEAKLLGTDFSVGGLDTDRVLQSLQAQQSALNKQRQSLGDLTEEERKAATEKLASELEVSNAISDQVRLIQQKLQLSQLEAQGVDNIAIAQADLVLTVQRLVKEHRGFEVTSNENVVATNKVLGLLSQQELKVRDVAEAIGLSAAEYDKVLEVVNKVAAIEQERLKRIQEFSEGVKGAFTNVLVDAFEGDSDALKNFSESLRRTIFTTLSETVVNSLFTSFLGQFTSAIGGALVGTAPIIQTAHLTGVTSAVPLIIQAHQTGIALGTLQSQGLKVAGTAAQAGAGAAGASAGAAAGSAGGIAAFLANPIVGAAILALAITASVVASRRAEKKSLEAQGIQITSPSFSERIFRGDDVVITTASALIGRDRDAAQHIGKDGRRTQFTSFLGPLGLGFNALTFKSSATLTKVEEFRLSSKIDVTNKELQVVNRNLVALRSSMETLLRPNSEFFAEKGGSILESQFSISSRRGT